MAYQLCLMLLMLPAVVWAHGSEFLGAKLQVLPSRELHLEITADYGDNPMLTDRTEAVTALKALLKAGFQGRSVALSELAPLQWEDRTEPDRASPLPTDDSGKAHQLLTAVWRWTPPAGTEEIRFQVADEVNHATVFWLEEEGVPRAKKKWSMLLSGDTTPVIRLPAAPLGNGYLGFLAIICLGAALVVVLRRTRTLPS